MDKADAMQQERKLPDYSKAKKALDAVAKRDNGVSSSPRITSNSTGVKLRRGLDLIRSAFS